VLGWIFVRLHNVPASSRVDAVIGIVIEVRSTQSVEKLMADHPHSSAGQEGLKLEVEIIHPFAVDIHIAVIETPAMGPEQAAPSSGRAFDDKDHVVHPAVVVRIDREAGRDGRSHRGTGILEQGKLPVPPLVITVVASRIGRGIGLKI